MTIENFNPENFNDRRNTAKDAVRAVEYITATLSTDKTVREKLDNLRYELVEKGRSDLSRVLKVEGYEVVDYDSFHALTESFLLRTFHRSQIRFECEHPVTEEDIKDLEVMSQEVEAEYGFKGLAGDLHENKDGVRRMLVWHDKEELVEFFRGICTTIKKS